MFPDDYVNFDIATGGSLAKRTSGGEYYILTPKHKGPMTCTCCNTYMTPKTKQKATDPDDYRTLHDVKRRKPGAPLEIVEILCHNPRFECPKCKRTVYAGGTLEGFAPKSRYSHDFYEQVLDDIVENWIPLSQAPDKYGLSGTILKKKLNERMNQVADWTSTLRPCEMLVIYPFEYKDKISAEAGAGNTRCAIFGFAEIDENGVPQQCRLYDLQPDYNPSLIKDFLMKHSFSNHVLPRCAFAHHSKDMVDKLWDVYHGRQRDFHVGILKEFIRKEIRSHIKVSRGESESPLNKRFRALDRTVAYLECVKDFSGIYAQWWARFGTYEKENTDVSTHLDELFYELDVEYVITGKHTLPATNTDKAKREIAELRDFNALMQEWLLDAWCTTMRYDFRIPGTTEDDILDAEDNLLAAYDKKIAEALPKHAGYLEEKKRRFTKTPKVYIPRYITEQKMSFLEYFKLRNLSFEELKYYVYTSRASKNAEGINTRFLMKSGYPGPALTNFYIDLDELNDLLAE